MGLAAKLEVPVQSLKMSLDVCRVAARRRTHRSTLKCTVCATAVQFRSRFTLPFLTTDNQEPSRTSF